MGCVRFLSARMYNRHSCENLIRLSWRTAMTVTAASYEIRNQDQFREPKNKFPGQQLAHMIYEKKALIMAMYCCDIHNQVINKLNTIFEPIEWAAVQMVEQQGYPRVRALEGLVGELPPPGRAVEFALSWSPTKRSDVMILRAVHSILALRNLTQPTKSLKNH